MQHESLKTYRVPLLVYETYIDGNMIHLKFLSELLRMSEPDAIKDEYKIEKKARSYKYEGMLKKYEKLKEAELNEKIKYLIDASALDERYFKYEKPSCKREIRKVRFMNHYFHYLVVLFIGITEIAILIILIPTILSFFCNIGVEVLSSDEFAEMIFFGVIGFVVIFNSYFRGTRKPTKYEKMYSFSPTTYTDMITDDNIGLPFDDTIKIQTNILNFDVSNIQTPQDIYNVEVRVFNDVCEMIKECAKKYHGIHYAVTLERSKSLSLDNEEMPKIYISSIFVYLARNHVILERGKGVGEWPGSFSEIIRIRGNKIKFEQNYKENILENIEWYSQVYLEDKETHFENKEESDQFVNNSSLIMWIDE